MKKLFFVILCLTSLLLFAEDFSFTVKDKPNDNGSNLILKWTKPADFEGKIKITRTDDSGKVNISNYNNNSKLDENLHPNKTYLYSFKAFSKNGKIIFDKGVKIKPIDNWFNMDKLPFLIILILISGAIIYYIYSARSGKELYIRKISGLESMDEAVGRATELGKPILFVPGINDIDDMQTIAGLTILGQLAQKSAEYGADLIVPVSKSMVLSTAREIVKESYLKAGHPDDYKEDSVFYLTDDQFGFVAGIDGIIVREKPAANFFLGAFYAESLILAETGFTSGAIQTAGTAMPSQLPFFVAACDYTLIGEELFAASAYLSRDPQQLGSLKGQDFGKALLLILLTAGVILEMFNIHFLKDLLIIK
jgi:hypothetical protein